MLLEEVAREEGADVFASTYYTTPMSTPAVQLVYDMIPEKLAFDLNARVWKEKHIALAYASHCICISENTKADLLEICDYVDPRNVSVGYCGVDDGTFYPRSNSEVARFREQHDLAAGYLITAGSREQHKGYKNVSLLFQALKLSDLSIDVVCAGGEPFLPTQWLDGLPGSMKVKRLDLSDTELAVAYSGASALVFPSLYEGFGMPLIEAMSCGCPVITTGLGSLREVAGEAAELISGADPCELGHAIKSVRDPNRRRYLVEAGATRSRHFSWTEMANVFVDKVKSAHQASTSDSYIEFSTNWTRVRLAQAACDTLI